MEPAFDTAQERTSHDDTAPGTLTGAAAPMGIVRPGDVLAGRYEVLRELGRGGTGVVFEVCERDSGARLALKALRAPRPALAHLLKSEFRALRGVLHPSLVAHYDLVVDEEHAFLTMQLVEGRPLPEVARGAPALRSMFLQCAEALAALHAAGRVHRDVKPANVLVDEEGRVTVLDFGLTTGVGAAEDVAGTPAWTAPERRAGGRVTPASDWYGFGGLLLEALADVRFSPRVARDAAATLALAGAAEDLAALTIGLLAEDPDERAGWAEVIATLGQGGGTEPMRRTFFVGRDRELAALARLLDAARTAPQVVVLRGAAGSGKTTLASRFLGEAGATGAVTLRAACHEYESLAFNAFDGVVDGLVRVLVGADDDVMREVATAASVFPVLKNVLAPGARPALDDAPPRERRRAAFAALVALLGRTAARAPLVLLLDDVQWADGDSAELLRELVHASLPGLLLIAAWRDDDDHLALADAWRDAPSGWQVSELALPGLPDDDAERLVAGLRGVPPGAPGVAAAVAAGGGNPFLLEELAAASEVRDARTALLDRLASLSEQGRRLVELVSAGRGEVPEAVVHQLVLVGPTGGRQLVKALCDRRLLRWTSERGGLDVYHGRVRDLVYEALAEGERRARHAALIGALLAVPDSSAAALAEQMVLAGDERALAQCRAASREARAALAFRQAERWLKTALALPEATDSDATELYAELGEVLSVAGRGREAAAAHARAAAGSSGLVALDRQRLAAEQRLFSGDAQRGFAELTSVLRAHGVTPPRTTAGAIIGLLAGRARRRVFGPPPPCPPSAEGLARLDALAAASSGSLFTNTLRGAWFATLQLRDAERLGDPERLLRAFAFEAAYLANEGPKNAAALGALVERARALGEGRGDTAAGLASFGAGTTDLLLGRWRTSERHYAEAERALGRGSDVLWFELTMARKYRTIAAWFTGSLPLLESEASAWLEDARERGDRLAERSFEADRPSLLLLTGRAGEARACLARATVLSSGAFDEQALVIAHNEALLALHEGAPPDALASIEERLRPFWRSLLATGQLQRVTTRNFQAQCLVAAALAGGPRAGSQRRAVLRAARRLDREGVRYARCFAALLRAACAHQRGDDVIARDELSRASALATQDGQALLAASARYRLGKVTGGDEGEGLVTTSIEALMDAGVRAPERTVCMLAPGFRE